MVGCVGPRPFWVGLVGPLFEIYLFPREKVFKFMGWWASQIPPPPWLSRSLPRAMCTSNCGGRTAYLQLVVFPNSVTPDPV